MHILTTIFLALLISGCSSLKVATDYDQNADLTPPKNFTIVHKALEGEDTLTSDRIIAALKNELTQKGYTESSRDSADFYVLFHTGVTSKTRVDTEYRHVNMYPYSYGYGYRTVAVPQTRTYNYEEAKLIVDAVVPGKNKIIWRGTAVDYLKNLKTPQKKTAYINKVLKALMENFPK